MTARQLSLIATIALLAGLAVVPFFGGYVAGIATEILIFAIFAMSLGLLVGFTGLMSFGHAAFFGVSAYTTCALGVYLGVSGWWGMLAGVLLSGALAAFIGVFCIRVAGIPFLMLTLAFAQLVLAAAIKWRGLTGGTDGLIGFQRPTLFGVSLDDQAILYGVVAVGFVLVLAFLRRLVQSPLGSIFIGIRDNEQRMRAIGYPVQRFKLIAFTIAGALAGVAGAFYALFNVYVSPDLLHWSLSGDAIIMVVLGGSATILGPAVGAALFLLLKNIISSHNEYWQLWVGALFILSVIFLRQGVWGFVSAQIRRLVGSAR